MGARGGSRSWVALLATALMGRWSPSDGASPAFGVMTVPDFRDPKARLLIDGPVWRFMLRRAGAKAADPAGEFAAKLRPWIDGIVLRVAFIDDALARSGARLG